MIASFQPATPWPSSIKVIREVRFDGKQAVVFGLTADTTGLTGSLNHLLLELMAASTLLLLLMAASILVVLRKLAIDTLFQEGGFAYRW